MGGLDDLAVFEQLDLALPGTLVARSTKGHGRTVNVIDVPLTTGFGLLVTVTVNVHLLTV